MLLVYYAVVQRTEDIFKSYKAEFLKEVQICLGKRCFILNIMRRIQAEEGGRILIS